VDVKEGGRWEWAIFHPKKGQNAPFWSPKEAYPLCWKPKVYYLMGESAYSLNRQAKSFT
jgi:hypothetical protein